MKIVLRTSICNSYPMTNSIAIDNKLYFDWFYYRIEKGYFLEKEKKQLIKINI